MSKIKLSKTEVEEFLRERGWEPWYNEAYWVHPDLIVDPMIQDYTNYGMDLRSAYAHECLRLGPFAPLGLSGLSMMRKGIENAERIKHFLERYDIT